MAHKLKRSSLMGILNVTPDSFSDGGDFFDPELALSRALKMAGEGADIIDIGGESSRPGSESVSLEEEMRRVLPVIQKIRKHSDIQISIDTRRSKVAEECLSAGANMINDISAGTFDPDILKVAAEKNVPICLMHMKGDPKTMQKGEICYDDVVGEICDYLKERVKVAVAAGIKKENIIIDPGIGFGKTTEHNVAILKELKRFKELGCRLLMGTSRKSFIGNLLGIKEPKDRMNGTLATVAIALMNGTDILRVHDVKETKEFCDVFTHLWQ